MQKLFVDKTININAPAARIWKALTNPENTDQWAYEFSSGGPRLHIESDWALGSPVLWKGEDGKVVVQGKVTALEQNKLLRFTVFDVHSEQGFEAREEDGITFKLSEESGKTTLHVLQGDFLVIKEGQKYRDMSEIIWDRVLPKIKELAEK